MRLSKDNLTPTPLRDERGLSPFSMVEKGQGMRFARKYLIICVILLLSITAHAQEGLGAVPVPLATTLRDTVVCDYCRTLYGIESSPMLFAINPLTLDTEPANENNLGLVVNTYDPTKGTQILKLRKDLMWDDGSPVTAYDVLFTFIDNEDMGFEGLRILNDYEIEVTPIINSCSLPIRSLLPIASYRKSDVNFPQAVAAFDFSGDIAERIAEFEQSYFANPINRPTQFYSLDNVQRSETYIEDEPAHLWTFGDSPITFLTLGSQGNRFSPFDNFRWGRTNIIVRPPRELWTDLRAIEDADFALLPPIHRVYMIFPIADPYQPQPAFDDKGQPLDQGVNPIFEDVRVRRAMQLALNVPAIIDKALDGEGSTLASFQPPASWAHDPTLAPIEQNLEEARRLLDEAGWRDLGNDKILDCVNCDTAEYGTPLRFTLAVPSGEAWYTTTAAMMSEQLRAIGVRMDWDYSDPSFVDNGYAALIVEGGYNFDFDPSRNFSQLADSGILGNQNYGSYTNPEVEDLLEQVRQNPTCSVPERADLLQQVDRIFQEDPPALWLFTVNEYMVTRGITGIQPSAYNPLWNIRDWTVRP